MDEFVIPKEAVLSIPVFLFSLTVHEFAHALVATKGGDDTPRLQNRLTLNPLPHIDILGTIIIPIIGLLNPINFPLIGWAKPVQVNPQRFKRPVWMLWVAVAGPISNLLLALAAALALKGVKLAIGNELPEVILLLGQIFITLNITLAIFNMIPIPPLDGSRVLFHFLVNGRPKFYNFWAGLERYGFFILYIFIIATPTRAALSTAVGFSIDLVAKTFGLTG